MWPFKKVPPQAETRPKMDILVEKLLASKNSGLLAGWNPTHESLTKEIQTSDLRLIRKRCREIAYNSPLIHRAVMEYQSALVGNGIRVLLKVPRNQRAEDRLMRMWNKFVNSTDFSSDGQMDFYSMQKAVTSEIATVGEVFIKKNYIQDSAGETRLSYQLVEADRLADQGQGFQQGTDVGGRRYFAGISTDDYGRRESYLFYNFGYNNLNQTVGFNSLKRTAIPASQIHHIFKNASPTFQRGLPLIMSAISYAKLSSELESAELKKQTIASCFAAFIHDLTGDIEYGGKRAPGGNEVSEIEPGTVQTLPAGKTITFTDAPEFQGYKDFNNSIAQKISSALGLSYEIVTGDYSETNYSSARHASQTQHTRMSSLRQDVIIQKMIKPVVNDFLSYAEVQGVVKMDSVEMAIVPPAQIVIDPAKEIAPKILAIRAGLSTWTDYVMANGQDPQEAFDKLVAEKEMFARAGIILDIDASKVDRQGRPADEPQGEEDADRDRRPRESSEEE